MPGLKLSGLKLTLSLPTAAAIAQPKRKQPKFLPGETRATCGIDGFRQLEVAAYMRRLYANSECRNLTPPQHINDREPERLGTSSYSVDEFKCRKNRMTEHLISECLCALYVNHLHENLHTAHYRRWELAQWSWNEQFANCSPALTFVPAQPTLPLAAA
jgi:hypothetical protein